MLSPTRPSCADTRPLRHPSCCAVPVTPEILAATSGLAKEAWYDGGYAVKGIFSNDGNCLD